VLGFWRLPRRSIEDTNVGSAERAEVEAPLHQLAEAPVDEHGVRVDREALALVGEVPDVERAAKVPVEIARVQSSGEERTQPLEAPLCARFRIEEPVRPRGHHDRECGDCEESHDGRAAGAHRSDPMLTCSSMGRPARSSPQPTSTRTMPAGDAQRRPVPTPFLSGVPKLFTAFPMSKNAASPHCGRKRWSTSTLPVRRYLPPITLSSES